MLLIIPCIIYYETNKKTLNLEPWINRETNEGNEGDKGGATETMVR